MCGPNLRPGKGGGSTSCGGHGDVLPLSPRTPEPHLQPFLAGWKSPAPPSTPRAAGSLRVSPTSLRRGSRDSGSRGSLRRRLSTPLTLLKKFFLRSLPGMALEAAGCFLILSQGSTQLVGNLPGSNRGRIAVIRIFELRISLFFFFNPGGKWNGS